MHPETVMRTLHILALLASMAPWHGAVAEDLVITNARIIDGTGLTIENGEIVIAGGRISAVRDAATGPSPAGAVTIDANGMTVMPGMIDTHRHDLFADLRGFTLIDSDAGVAAAIDAQTPAKLGTLLDEGFTTVMMPGLYLEAALDVRRRLASGDLEGPRLLFSGPAFTAPGDFPVKGMVCGENAYCSANVAFEITGAEDARAHVGELSGAGVDAIKVMRDKTGNDLDEVTFRAIVAEADEVDLPVYLHAHGVDVMLDGVRLGADRLAHTPSDALLSAGPAARLMRENEVAVATTVSFTSPQFAEAMGFPYQAADRHERLLQNIRHLVDEGVPVAFGTDSPDLRPIVEILELGKVLAPAEVVATLTTDAATYLDMQNEIGTLEPGKIADIVIIDGDPLTDLSDLVNVELVIQGGRVVVDDRSP